MNVETKRKRKYFLGGNWKCNGTTAFCKDIIENMVNDFEYDSNQLGKGKLYPDKFTRFNDHAGSFTPVIGAGDSERICSFGSAERFCIGRGGLHGRGCS